MLLKTVIHSNFLAIFLNFIKTKNIQWPSPLKVGHWSTFWNWKITLQTKAFIRCFFTIIIGIFLIPRKTLAHMISNKCKLVILFYSLKHNLYFFLDAMKKEHLVLIVAVFAVDILNCSLINGHWENGCDLGFLFK